MVYSDETRIRRLGDLVKQIRDAGIVDAKTKKKLWLSWGKKNKKELEKVFEYKRTNKKGTKEIYDLFDVFFHPKYPLLIGFTHANKITHWTEPLKLCRGLIFDTNGQLLARPYKKFFKLNETPETVVDELSEEETFTVVDSYSDHLTTAFLYDDGSGSEIVFATKDSFTSSRPAYELLYKMLFKYPSNKIDWHLTLSARTFLFEVVHPEYEENIDYHKEEALILVGITAHDPFDEWGVGDVQNRSIRLGVDSLRTYNDYSLDQLINQKASSNKDFIVKFEDGLRVEIMGKGE